MDLFVELFVDGVVGLVFGYDFFHLGDGGHVVVLFGDGYEVVDLLAGFVVVVFTDLGDADLLVEGGFGAFEFVEDFLVELLTFTEAREFDLHVLGA